VAEPRRGALRKVRGRDPRRRFAFVTLGSFSWTNPSLLPLLEERFPDLAVDVIDVRSWVRSRRSVVAANLAAVMREHGLRMTLDRRLRWGLFWRTAYIFEAVRKAMRERVALGDYAFTIQTQSMFDASVPGVPHFVYTDHTARVSASLPGFTQRAPWPAGWFEREGEIYHHARWVFTMSDHVAQSVIEDYGVDADRVRCVYAGSNADFPDAASLQNGYGSKQVLFVGLKWRLKGGPDLLAAFELLRQREPEARLAIVGCEPPVEAENVTVFGRVPLEAIAGHYAHSAVFCMPTQGDAFGIAFVEALSHGLPVVGTRLGAVPEIVQDGETGYLVEPGDVRGLADALWRLLADPERCRAFGTLGRRRMLERYTWPRVADSIATTISSTTGHPSAAPTGR
jgi:glycosyltransferase involved in cell wall biosynthesis